MNTCDTCKHWGMSLIPKGPYCNNEKVVLDICENERFDVSGSKTDAGSIYVGAKFGCVHHEPKESE